MAEEMGGESSRNNKYQDFYLTTRSLHADLFSLAFITQKIVSTQPLAPSRWGW